MPKTEADPKRQDRKNTFSNHEIVTLAVYLLGGDSRYVDTEDVAVKTNEVAPGRFTWRKHPQQINLEIIRVYLSDAKKSAKGRYLLGSGNDGWLLTEKGLMFARRHIRRLKEVDLHREALSPKEQHRRRRERNRMLSTNAYLKFRTEGAAPVSRQEAEAFFRLDEYVVGKAREQKITRIINTYGDDSDLGPAVKELAEKVRER